MAVLPALPSLQTNFQSSNRLQPVIGRAIWRRLTRLVGMVNQYWSVIQMFGECSFLFMQCCFLNWFLSMLNGHAQKPFQKQHCKNTPSPKHLNYRPLVVLSYQEKICLLIVRPTLWSQVLTSLTYQFKLTSCSNPG